MIIQKNRLSESEFPSTEGLLPPRAIFFDIETTGLSHRTSHLYMIGAVYREEQEWHYIQWFLQKPGEEKEMLQEFAAFLSLFEPVIHYNGKTFDLPYLQGRYRHWELPDPFAELTDTASLDLYRELSPLKTFLGLTSMKQKAVEQLLHFPRTDERDGKELIDVYQHYLQTADEEDLQLLLLHNHDDLLGMLTIYQFYHWLTKELQHPALRKAETQDQLLVLHLATEMPAPMDLTFRSETAALSIAGNETTLVLAGCCGCFRHYYPNYRDYFYLPLEDTAIHKSVGVYVDPSCREKAKADTCYTKKDGLFFPQVSPVLTPDFRRDSRKGSSWFSEEQLQTASSEQLIQVAVDHMNTCLRTKEQKKEKNT